MTVLGAKSSTLGQALAVILCLSSAPLTDSGYVEARGQSPTARSDYGFVIALVLVGAHCPGLLHC